MFFCVSLTAFDFHANYIVNRLLDSQTVMTLMLFQGKEPFQRSAEQDSHTILLCIEKKTENVLQANFILFTYIMRHACNPKVQAVYFYIDPKQTVVCVCLCVHVCTNRCVRGSCQVLDMPLKSARVHSLHLGKLMGYPILLLYPKVYPGFLQYFF